MSWDDPEKREAFSDWTDDDDSGSDSGGSSSNDYDAPDYGSVTRNRSDPTGDDGSGSDINDAAGPTQEEMRESESSRSSGGAGSSGSGGSSGSDSYDAPDYGSVTRDRADPTGDDDVGGGRVNDDTSYRRMTPSERQAVVGGRDDDLPTGEQGVEEGDGRLAEQARELERQVTEDDPFVSEEGVTVEQQDGQLVARLNERGEYGERQRIATQARTEVARETGISPQDVDVTAEDGRVTARPSDEMQGVLAAEAQRERRQYRRTGIESQSDGEQFGDIGIPVPGTGNTVEDYLDAGAEAYDRVADRAGSFASRATANFAYSDPTVSQLGYESEAEVSQPDAEIDNSFSRFMEGSTEGAIQLGNLASTASGVKEAGEFVGWAATETAAGRGGEAAEQTGAAAASLGAAAASEARENPAQTAGMVAGSLVGSTAAMGGAARASSRAGRATRYGIQPGEEILSDTATIALSRSSRGQRVLDRIPGGRLDNEELAIAAGRGAASRISDADISGSARAAASRARRAIEETRSPESRGLYASDEGELFSERNPLGTPLSTDLGEESVTRQIADRVTNPEPQSTYFSARTGEPFTERNPLGRSLLAERTSTPEGPQTNDDVVVFEDLESSVESETTQEMPDDTGFDVDSDADASDVGSSGGGGDLFVEAETQTASGQVMTQRYEFPAESEVDTRAGSSVRPELDTEVETEFQRASEVSDLTDRATESGIGEGLGTNFEVGEINVRDFETGFETSTDTMTDTGLETGLETGTSTETDYGTELETEFGSELETELGLEAETEARTEAEVFGRSQNRRRQSRDELFGADDETFETGIWDVDDSGFSF